MQKNLTERRGSPYDDWQPDPDLNGWEPRTHPEGSLYFYHRQKVREPYYHCWPWLLREVL